MRWIDEVFQAIDRIAEQSEDGPVPAYAPELGPCRLWTGRIAPDGYPRIKFMGTTMNASRVAWAVENGGPPPPKLHVDHLCRVRHCVRSSHLELVTPAENYKRSPLMQKRLFCKRGHALSDDNVYVNNNNGARTCKICAKARAAKYREEHRDYWPNYRASRRKNKGGE